MCVRQAACGLLWLWRFMCLPWRAKLCSSTPQSASERESVFHPSRLFPATFPPYPISAPFLPSLTHPLFLSLLFLLSCFCFCLSLHLFLPPSFLACCPGCYQECRNIDVMSRGWKNRQIRFLLWFLRLLTYLRMRGWIVACCFSAEKKSSSFSRSNFSPQKMNHFIRYSLITWTFFCPNSCRCRRHSSDICWA